MCMPVCENTRGAVEQWQSGLGDNQMKTFLWRVESASLMSEIVRGYSPQAGNAGLLDR